MDIKKGDVIKTSLSDSTIVLEVNGTDVVLMSGHNIVEASGIEKNDDTVTWGS